MKALIVAAALGVLSLPAFAQQAPGTGTNSGGPGRVGIPGQIGGGVPGSQPNITTQRENMTPAAAARPRTAKPRKAKRKSMRRARR